MSQSQNKFDVVLSLSHSPRPDGRVEGPVIDSRPCAYALKGHKTLNLPKDKRKEDLGKKILFQYPSITFLFFHLCLFCEIDQSSLSFCLWLAPGTKASYKQTTDVAVTPRSGRQKPAARNHDDEEEAEESPQEKVVTVDVEMGESEATADEEPKEIKLDAVMADESEPASKEAPAAAAATGEEAAAAQVEKVTPPQKTEVPTKGELKELKEDAPSATTLEPSPDAADASAAKPDAKTDDPAAAP